MYLGLQIRCCSFLFFFISFYSFFGWLFLRFRGSWRQTIPLNCCCQSTVELCTYYISTKQRTFRYPISPYFILAGSNLATRRKWNDSEPRKRTLSFETATHLSLWMLLYCRRRLLTSVTSSRVTSSGVTSVVTWGRRRRFRWRRVRCLCCWRVLGVAFGRLVGLSVVGTVVLKVEVGLKVKDSTWCPYINIVIWGHKNTKQNLFPAPIWPSFFLTLFSTETTKRADPPPVRALILSHCHVT